MVLSAYDLGFTLLLLIIVALVLLCIILGCFCYHGIVELRRCYKEAREK